MKDWEKILEETKAYLEEWEVAFCRRVFDRDVAEYRERLQAIGFSDLGRVLDAGCGFGQWSLVLASMCEEVIAVDSSNGRTMFLSYLSQDRKVRNLRVIYGKAENLNFGRFDGIFCYSSILYMRVDEILEKFARWLVPGGKIYISSSALGWFLHLRKSMPNTGGGYDPREEAGLAFWNTWQYERNGKGIEGWPLILEPSTLVNKIELAGFQMIEVAPEGTIVIGKGCPKPFFEAEYEGCTGVYEILAER